MSDKKQVKKRIHMIYGTLLSVLIVATGIALMVSCVQIYKSGRMPFTRESVKQAFDKIAVLVYACLGGIALGAVLSLICPLDGAKLTGGMEAKRALAKQYTRINPLALSLDARHALKKESRHRVVLRCVLALICAVTLVPLALYLCDSSHFTADLNGSILAAVYMALPFVLIGGTATLCEIALENASIARESEQVKAIIAAGTAPGWNNKCRYTESRAQKFGVWAVRIIVLVVGIAFVVMGIENGGMRDVLGKAIKICTECIGLG